MDLERTDALERIAALADAPLDAAALASEAARAVAALVGADGVIVGLPRPEAPDLVVGHGECEALRRALADRLAVESLLSPALLQAARDGDASDGDDAVLPEHGISSVVAAAVPAGGDGVGALVVLRRAQSSPFETAEVALLRLAGRSLGLVLAARSARRQHERALARERIVARAVSRTALAATLDAALEATAAGARRVTNASFAAVVLARGGTASVVAATPGPLRDALDSGPSASPLSALAPFHEVSTRGPALRRAVVLSRPAAYLRGLGFSGAVLSGPGVAGRSLVGAPMIAPGGRLEGVVLALIDGTTADAAALEPLETLASSASATVRRLALQDQLEEAYGATVATLAKALEAKDGPTGDHGNHTARLALAVGRRIGVRGAALRTLEFAAILHDVGKIGIPARILEKPGPLDADEWATVREHTRIGERIIAGAPFLAGAARVVRCAHERWDGAGYPDGLRGPEIPLASRIIFACDTWDVMRSDRPYRRAIPHDAALERLRAAAGSQLDPGVVTALEHVIAEGVVPGTGVSTRAA